MAAITAPASAVSTITSAASRKAASDSGFVSLR